MEPKKNTPRIPNVVPMAMFPWTPILKTPLLLAMSMPIELRTSNGLSPRIENTADMAGVKSIVSSSPIFLPQP